MCPIGGKQEMPTNLYLGIPQEKEVSEREEHELRMF
jgi:hypothetical protein